MLNINLIAAWAGILLGLLSGIPMGLAFHKPGWLGGYDSWPRRLIRLGHISFFGIAFLNLAFVISVREAGISAATLHIPSLLLVIAQASMPAVCFLAAFKKPWRQLFFIPVSTAVGGTALFLFALIQGVAR
jgi:hypothetical protein